MIDRTDPNFLLSTMDANEWATEFCKRFPSMDHGTMLGWFANSIMTGYDEANRRAVPQASAEQDAERINYLEAWNTKNKGKGFFWNTFSFSVSKTVREQLDDSIRAASKTTPSSGEGA